MTPTYWRRNILLLMQGGCTTLLTSEDISETDSNLRRVLLSELAYVSSATNKLILNVTNKISCTRLGGFIKSYMLGYFMENNSTK